MLVSYRTEKLHLDFLLKVLCLRNQNAYLKMVEVEEKKPPI